MAFPNPLENQEQVMLPHSYSIRSILFTLVVLLSAYGPANGQPKTLNQLAAEEKYPLVYKADLAKKVRESHLKFHRAATIDVFEKGAQVKATWAPQAKAVLELYARRLTQIELSGSAFAELDALSVKLSQEAVKAGCDDPLVRYLAEERLARVNRSDPKIVAKFAVTIADLNKSQYGDARKLYAVWNWLSIIANQLPTDDPLRKDMVVWENRFWELFEKVAGENTPAADAAILEMSALKHSPLPNRTRRQGYEIVASHLEKAKASKWLRLMVEAQFLNREGWDARGSGAASTVTAEGAKVFQERVSEAREKLEAAWDIDKTRFQVPTEMILVCKDILPDRAKMETWFARAMEINPDNRLACLWKINYLSPKWRGTQDEYLSFGWICAISENYEGQIPLVVIDLHGSNAPLTGPVFANDPARVGRYYAQPPFWSTVSTAAERMLAARPENTDLRTYYAKVACLAGKYDVAAVQFEKLGKNYSPRYFLEPGEYEQCVEMTKKGTEMKK